MPSTVRTSSEVREISPYTNHSFRLIIFFHCRLTEDEDFETLDLTPYSQPPDLPDVMKNQESANGQDQIA